jgi:hypothetical protein
MLFCTGDPHTMDWLNTKEVEISTITATGFYLTEIQPDLIIDPCTSSEARSQGFILLLYREFGMHKHPHEGSGGVLLKQ